MWNMALSPLAFSKLTPRERMHATLNGLGNTRDAVETRGANGEFQSLVMSSLYGPRPASQFVGGKYQAAVSPRPMSLTFAKPLGIKRTLAPDSVVTGSQVVRGLADVGSFGLVASNLLTARPDLQPVAPLTSRALPPDIGLPPAPAGSGVQQTDPAELKPPGSEAPPVVTAQVDPATAAPPTGLPLWQIAAGAAAVFGSIWFITRRA